MNKKILIGSILAVILLVLMSFSPSITANVSKPDVDVVEDVATPTPIVLVLQLITKLRNHKDIQNIESEDDVLRIIESDEELNSIIEQLSAYGDCGCEDDTTRLWKFPVICFLLLPITWFALLLYFMGDIELIGDIVGFIGYTLDCFWFF